VILAHVPVSACDEGGDERLDQLEAARVRWTASAPADYAFDYRRTCFCPFTNEVRVEVASSIVVRVTEVETSVVLPEDQLAGFPTIEGLFVELHQLILGEPHLLEVEYDPLLGFPARVQVDIEEYAVDEEFGYTVANFAPVLVRRPMPAPGVRP
jgi:hypothetical protein